jgi:uncharacterized protein (DUF58 family)
MKRFRGAKVTKLGLVPRFSALALGALAVVTGNAWLLFMACGAAGIAIGAYLIRPKLTAVALFVGMPERGTAGGPVTGQMRIENTGPGWSPMAHLSYRMRGFSTGEIRVDPLPPGGCVVADLNLVCESRGVVTGSAARLVSVEPLGLLEFKSFVSFPGTVIAHPREVPVRVPTPRGGGSDDREWVVSRSGTDVHTIREWRPGDEASQVHWRSTARRGRLVVLEREMPRAGGLAIVLSAGSGDDSWESVISVAGWTAAATAQTGRPVALIASQSGVQLVTGDAPALLDWCASLGTGALAGQAEIQRAADFSGRGGDVLVACGAASPPGWWDWASDFALTQGVELQPLSLTD